MEKKTTTLYLVSTSYINGVGYFEIVDSFDEAKEVENYFLILYPVVVSIYKKDILTEDIETMDGDYNEFYDDLCKRQNLISKWDREECLYCESPEFHHVEIPAEIVTLMHHLNQMN